MKIYTKIVIDMATDTTIEAEWFDYEGEVAQCWTGAAIIGGAVVGGLMSGAVGGDDVEYPGPSETEQELRRLQLEMLQAKQEDIEMMEPWMLQAMGLAKDESGNLYKMDEEELLAGMGELEKGQYELTKAYQERAQQALAGEIPISPALESSLAGQEKQMSEALAQRLGTGWETTTAGQQAMSTFKERASLVREEARRGVIRGGGASALANLGAQSHLQGAKVSQYGAYPGHTGELFQMAGQAMGPYQHGRQAQYQSSLMNAQRRAQKQAGLWGGMGSLLGAGVQAYGTYAGLHG